MDTRTADGDHCARPPSPYVEGGNGHTVDDVIGVAWVCLIVLGLISVLGMGFALGALCSDPLRCFVCGLVGAVIGVCAGLAVRA